MILRLLLVHALSTLISQPPPPAISQETKVDEASEAVNPPAQGDTIVQQSKRRWLSELVNAFADYYARATAFVGGLGKPPPQPSEGELQQAVEDFLVDNMPKSTPLDPEPIFVISRDPIPADEDESAKFYRELKEKRDRSLFDVHHAHWAAERDFSNATIQLAVKGGRKAIGSIIPETLHSMQLLQNSHVNPMEALLIERQVLYLRMVDIEAKYTLLPTNTTISRAY